MTLEALTVTRLRSVVEYDAETGVFRWKMGRRGVRAGAVAGSNGKYVLLGIDGRQYLGHRLAWLYVNGAWPNDQLDHFDRNKRNNAISNLREATQSDQVQNLSLSRRNKSGHKGVYWAAHRGKWSAQICFRRKKQSLGYFETAQSAADAYRSAKSTLHQFHPLP